jgi:hypothetical protein
MSTFTRRASTVTLRAARLAVLPLGIALLAACASSGSPRNEPAPGGDAPARAADPSLAQAATTPLGDLNLVRAPIPPVLAAALKAPYGKPADLSCATLSTDVQALDAVLGADLDSVPTASNPSLVERGANATGGAVVGAVRDSAEGVIPFRGWVRKLTGAERYAREVSAAIAAGAVRRAYLKGLGQSAGCAAPAAPKK